MPQYARPSADTDNTGGYTDQDGGSTDIYTTIDETILDPSDYIVSPQAPVDARVTFKLTSLTDPGSSSGHIIRVWTAKDPSNTDQVDLQVEVREGYTNEASPGLLRAILLVLDVSESLTEYS